MARKFVSFVLPVLLAACAAQSTREPPGGAQAVPGATPSPAPAAAIASSGDAAAPAASAEHPGYKTKKRKGETVYCKTVQPTGSLFPTEFCFTQAELDRQKQQAERMLNRPGACRQPDCVPTGQ